MATTTGQLTKRILKAAKTLTGEALYAAVETELNRFQLSSIHVVFDQDQAKHGIGDDQWATVIQAAVESDRRKMDRANDFASRYGGKPLPSFGRYVTPV